MAQPRGCKPNPHVKDAMQKYALAKSRCANRPTPPAEVCPILGAHHWLIGEANGSVSEGRCRCGAVKKFYNSVPEP